jgi:DNA-binding response OmpR family regulator
MLEPSVLIYSDEPTTGRIWALLVTDLQCHPLIVNSPPQAIQEIEESNPDIIVVDITGRGANGPEICAALRQHVANPILLLTPVNNESHTLEAYQAGVDECIIKPISPALFAAKTRVWLRRSRSIRAESLEKLVIGDLTLEPATQVLVGARGQKIQLSNLEFRVLYLLMSHPNQPYSNDEIIHRVWGIHGEGNSTLVKNVIYRLRRKVEPDLNKPRWIQTDSWGYYFKK